MGFFNERHVIKNFHFVICPVGKFKCLFQRDAMDLSMLGCSSRHFITALVILGVPHRIPLLNFTNFFPFLSQNQLPYPNKYCKLFSSLSEMYEMGRSQYPLLNKLNNQYLQKHSPPFKLNSEIRVLRKEKTVSLFTLTDNYVFDPGSMAFSCVRKQYHMWIINTDVCCIGKK